MLTRTLYIILLMLPSFEMAAQRQMVVVNVESKVPIRDVIVSADNGEKIRTPWDGVFSIPDSVQRIDFRHPDYEHRYVLQSEILGDTIFLIPNMNLLSEVVIYGERRFDKRMASMLAQTSQQKLDGQLERIKIPAGFNPIGFALWIYNKTFRKSVENRSHRKKALKEVRRQEAIYQEQWDALEKK